MKHLLAATRERFANQRQSRLFLWRPYNHLKRPRWARGRDCPFECLFQDYKMLLTKGTVVWGHLVQAYTRLFETGVDDFVANVLFSLEPCVDDELVLLEIKAQSLFGSKGRNIYPPEAQEIVDALTRGEVLFNRKLPQSMDHFGRNVYLTTIIVYRRHLPVPFLQSNWFPLLVLLEETPASMILPSRYWDAWLVKLWLQRISLPVSDSLYLAAQRLYPRQLALPRGPNETNP